jgi:hypothetical protein
MADPTKKQSLILALHEARGQLGGNIHGLKEDLSVGKRFRRSVRENRFAWIGGAAVLGLLLAKLPPMGRKVVVPQPIFARPPQKAGKAALLLGAIKIALDLGRPMIMSWLKDRALHRPPPSQRAERSRPFASNRWR